MTYILGISAYYSDSAAVLIQDGKILASVQEERFTRKKNDTSFPQHAICYCLQSANIELADVDVVAFYETPLLATSDSLANYLPKLTTYWRSLYPRISALKEKVLLKQTLKTELAALYGLKQKEVPKLLFTKRQEAHASSAFYPSPFKEAAVLCLDEVGHQITITAWMGRQQLMPLWQINVPHSSSAIQTIPEDILLKVANTLALDTRAEYLCLAGNLALHTAINAKLLHTGIFKDIWLQPAAGDAGGVLGAALQTWHRYLKQPRMFSLENNMQGTYLGPSYDQIEINHFLNSFSIPYKVLAEDTLFEKVSELLANDHVIGWFQGRMEFGPRALGARSIISGPQHSKIQDAETLLQTDIHPEANPRFYALMKKFEALTGYSTLVNTSFNIPGEPIVCSISDAYHCFMHIEMDFLILENAILSKADQLAGKATSNWPRAFILN